MSAAPQAGARQVAMVFDLNKCMGCQSCAVACKMIWTREPGEEQQWWCTVNTQPGRGSPRDWETMGGGYRDGRLVLGREPTAEEIGGGWSFNFDEVFYGGRGHAAHLAPKQDGRPPVWALACAARNSASEPRGLTPATKRSCLRVRPTISKM